MSDLQIFSYRDLWGSMRHEVQDRNPASLATVGYTVAASAMGAVLRKALRDHFASCEACETDPSKHCHWCDEAKALFELLPAGDRILIA